MGLDWIGWIDRQIERRINIHACMHTYSYTYVYMYMYVCVYIYVYIIRIFIDAYSIDMHRFLGGSGAKLAGGIPATSGRKRWTLSLSGHATRHRELIARRSSCKKHQEAMQLFSRKHTFLI